MRILIVKLSSIGDVVHTLPVLRTIRYNLPNSYIVWIVEEKTREILEGNKDVDRIITINTKKWRKGMSLRGNPELDSGEAIPAIFRELMDVINTLRKERFDTAIDLQGLIKSGVISYLSRAKTRIGFDSGNCRELLNILFTNKKASPAKEDSHVVDKNLSLLKPFGFKEIKRDFNIFSSQKDGEYINEFLIKNRLIGKSLIVVNPATGWKTKEWGIKNYAGLCDRIISEIGANIILTWGPGEENMVKGVMDLMAYKPLVAPPTTLKQIVALLRMCELFIGGDTGPLHIAAALKIPTVAIYGPSDPLRNGPYGDNHFIIHKKIECSGCYKRSCDTIECMKLISVDEVFSAIANHVSKYQSIKVSE
ncbi:MAG: lipopolysaccharide heptosyltransferase I [Nitrospinae bacterium]|nr:lipopolysaccharide heptosyltransferase I [Nitrospinota bacterium]